MEPSAEYWQQRAGEVEWEGIALAGYYNRNYRIGSEIGEVVIRIPIKGASRMDVVRIPEFVAHGYAAERGLPVPRIIHRDDEFSVLEYIPGRTVARTIEKWGLSDELLAAWVSLLVGTWAVDPAPMRQYFDGWAEWDDSRSLWRAVTEEFKAVWRAHEEWVPLLDVFGVPADALDRVGGWVDHLHPRPWVFCHGDLHGANAMVSPHGLVAIDWQLAIAADPAMELGTLLNRLRLDVRDEGRLVAEVARQWPDAGRPEFLADAQRWRGLELTKSLIVDAVRGWRAVHEMGIDEAARAAAAETLVDRLAMTSAWWGRRPWPAAVVTQRLLEFDPR